MWRGEPGGPSQMAGMAVRPVHRVWIIHRPDHELRRFWLDCAGVGR